MRGSRGGGGQGGLGPPPSPQNIAPPNSEARAKRALPPPGGAKRALPPPLTKSWIRLWGLLISRRLQGHLTVTQTRIQRILTRIKPPLNHLGRASTLPYSYTYVLSPPPQQRWNPPPHPICPSYRFYLKKSLFGGFLRGNLHVHIIIGLP